MHHFTFSHLPTSFSNMWVTNASCHEPEDHLHRELCNADDFYVPFSWLTSLDRHPLFNFPKLWNEFPYPEIKSTAHKSIFKQTLKKHFINELQDNYKCAHLLCPHCHLWVMNLCIFFHLNYFSYTFSPIHRHASCMGAIVIAGSCCPSGGGAPLLPAWFPSVPFTSIQPYPISLLCPYPLQSSTLPASFAAY
jgi:hypothetical protein